MPIYEYQCQKCGHKFEELVLRKKEIKCPGCKSTDLKKLFSAFSTPEQSGTSSGSDSDTCDSGTCNICSSCKP